MTARSASKVRGALGISRVILLLVLSYSLHAQTTDDLLQRNVTIIGSNIHFEDVLEQLTLQTKMHFIYSSSMVSLDKPVTLIARQHSLKNVLDELSSQMNVSFKRQGNYFVIKRNNAVAKSTFTIVQPKLANSEELDGEEFAEEEDKPQANQDDVYSFASRDAEITKDLLNFGDNLKLKYYPRSLTDNIKTPRQKRWFASAGLLINDYGAGVELQSGIPLLHAIVNFSALGDGMYRLGYGFGTAIPLKTGVAANLAYTFASLNDEEIDTWHNHYKSTSYHHQIRFMANISLSTHFSVRVGPTFNLLRTSYQYIPEPSSSAATIRYRQAPTQQYLSPSQGYTNSVHYSAPATPADYETANSWVGFELGVAYRVNFSLRK
ncbi:MAG TPA: STN domain-containing protein [Chryseolinea sp.]|nr:STN domain-containing protein [Chryseolinea sp.]